MKRMIKNSLFSLILIALAIGGFYYYTVTTAPKPEDLYRFQEVSQGDVEQSVSANGTINPVTLVSVGTQVSGRVSKLYVDFNDKVKEGQVLLELDPSLLTAQIAQTQGNVKNNEASVELAQANEVRMRTLYAQEYVSKQELDQAVQALKSAKAQLETTRAQLRRDQTNLGYSIIRSPVSGVVVDREVDLGQTVAASFQTPTLIKIAQDLSKMQIDSSFAEADIGNIKVGQVAKFNVDAFPNRNFEGVVKQVRLNPTTTSNVVTYDVVVSVDNPDETLLPGMTAYVNITFAKHTNVLLVPNAALRFKPKLDEQATMAARDKQKNGRDKHKVNQDGFASGKVYVLKQGKLEAVRVKTSLTDGKYTEIISNDLQAGTKVIIGETQADGSSSTTMRAPRMF